MIVKQELVNKIKDYFDLNIYETKVWLALLGKGVASAGEIAEVSGVPRSRTYDVLEGLEKRGFAIIKLGKPVKYLGVKPHIILEKMKNNVHKDAEDRLESLGKIKTTVEYEKLEELYREGIAPVKRETLHASIKGKSNITNHIKETLENAKDEVIICTNVEDFTYKMKIFQQTVDRLKKANIKVKIALSGNEEHIKQVSAKLGIKIKKVDVDAKFFIIDKKEVLFYLTKSPGDEETAIWLNSDFFSTAFANLFDAAMK